MISKQEKQLFLVAKQINEAATVGMHLIPKAAWLLESGACHGSVFTTVYMELLIGGA